MLMSWSSLPADLRRLIIWFTLAWTFIWFGFLYSLMAPYTFAADYTGAATGAELDYMNGVTSSVQTQLDGKISTGGACWDCYDFSNCQKYRGCFF